MADQQPQPVPEPQPQPTLQPQPQPPIQSDQNAYQTIIAQQQAQIDALIAQTNALNGQITQMVQGGMQFAQPMQQPTQQPMQQPMQQPQYPNYYQPANPMQQFNPPALSDNKDWSLEALGKEIGKPRKE